jgi:hypothetical protein
MVSVQIRHRSVFLSQGGFALNRLRFTDAAWNAKAAFATLVLTGIRE